MPATGPRGLAAPAKLLRELRDLIRAARGAVAQAVNSGQVVLYWQVGHRLRTEVLGAKRAGYGERIVVAVAERLTTEFGRGYTDKNLRHMIRFSEAFPDREIVYALSRQLSWTQFRSLIYLDDPLKRDFYARMCRIERWNTRTPEKKIGGMLFERTALSRKPEQLAHEELARLRAEDRLTAGGEQFGERLVAEEVTEFISDAEAESALGEGGVSDALGQFGDRRERRGARRHGDGSPKAVRCMSQVLLPRRRIFP